MTRIPTTVPTTGPTTDRTLPSVLGVASKAGWVSIGHASAVGLEMDSIPKLEDHQLRPRFENMVVKDVHGRLFDSSSGREYLKAFSTSCDRPTLQCISEWSNVKRIMRVVEVMSSQDAPLVDTETHSAGVDATIPSTVSNTQHSVYVAVIEGDGGAAIAFLGLANTANK